MDVIVLGGGLMGTASAYFLARRGAHVTLIERNRVGTGATVASFGNIRRTGRHLSQLPLAHRSLELWREADQMLGRDVEFRATGHIRLIFDEGSLADMRAYAEAARPWGLELEELGQREISSRFPGLGPDAIAASFSPHDGSGNPRLIAPAFAEAARKLGVAIVEDAEIDTIRRSGSGFVVVCSKGTFAAECLLNTAGAWGARIAAQFGEEVPLDACGPQMGVTEPLPYAVGPSIGVSSPIEQEGLYFRQISRGNIVFGGGFKGPAHADRIRAYVKPDNVLRQMRELRRVVPAFEHVQLIRVWSGIEGYIADWQPVMGPSARVPGLHYAFGFCGEGFAISPGVGETMAELIATGRTSTPIESFSIGRFAAASQKRAA